MRRDKTHTRTMGMGTGKPKKEEGFTLLEVIIAISIFSIGLLAIAAMQTSAIRVNSSAAKITELNTWGMDKLEELMGLSYTDPLLDPAGNTHQDPQNADGVTVRWDITDGDTTTSTPTPNTKLIVITVTGKGKTLRLVSLKSLSL
ncbi:MAG: prepilin-type N-terminal cleavage/methylation domain-containing protein [Deltaproteobacteria bacterium]|nr:prepilin-type N-terminal cleavage/methylation domain-containing protein [Deltaproteobacteria bacterium]MBW2014028.1 prepilin-type N-terminal cleavage/methylation domain-containing protein [Deltaproteobacteria bacterium]MBW2089695.1 prepilin-type N-terminal cleavage/methylation domain-containing protein [Deltaproteobacteria bacterium]